MMDPIQWGILGTGRITRRTARGIRESPLNILMGVASREQTRAERVARELGAQKAFSSYDEMLASREIDAVYIALPNSLHAEWSLKAAKAGKHILCEKPLASNSKEAHLVVETCEKENVLIMEADMYRHHPQHTKVKEIISSGRIGDPIAINARFSFYLEPSSNIRWSKELSGGALMDVGCYCINVSRLIYNSEPIKARAMAKYNSRYGVDASTFALLEFPEGRYASFTCSLLMNRANKYEVIGIEGSIEVPNAFVPLKDEVPLDVIIKINDREGMEEIHFAAVDMYRLEVEHFMKCIHERKLYYPAENGLYNMKAIDLVKESINFPY
jgi:predicted dehydrogenase